MPRVLLIDDDVHLGAPLASYFQRFDLALEHALTPGDGLQRLGRGRFDVAILTVMLPETDVIVPQGQALRREPVEMGQVITTFWTTRCATTPGRPARPRWCWSSGVAACASRCATVSPGCQKT